VLFKIHIITIFHCISFLKFRKQVKYQVHIFCFCIVNGMAEIFYGREAGGNADIRTRVGERASANFFFELFKREETRQRKADKNRFNIFSADEREQCRKFSIHRGAFHAERKNLSVHRNEQVRRHARGVKQYEIHIVQQERIIGGK